MSLTPNPAPVHRSLPFAELERGIIKERVKAGVQNAKAKG
jgi:hypothetical protein